MLILITIPWYGISVQPRLLEKMKKYKKGHLKSYGRSKAYSNSRSNDFNPLTLSWWRPLSYRNQSIDLQSKSMDWFLYDNGLRHERVKCQLHKMTILR